MKNYKEMKKREENYKTSLGGPIWDSKSFRKKSKIKEILQENPPELIERAR